MVFTLGPPAHLRPFATIAGLGTIFCSTGIVRFVQGGVVKTFRCRANNLMSWVKHAVAALETGQSAQVRPHGGSMRGCIESGQLVTIAPVAADAVNVDDVVFIRWKGNYILHIVKEIGDDGFLIGNNIGKINGCAAPDDVLGVVTAVAD